MEIVTVELQAVLEQVLSEHFGRRVRIADVARRPSEYRSSFAIEELDARLDDGQQLQLVWKDVSRQGLSFQAIDAKPEFLHDPLREIEVYRLVLNGCGFGTPKYFGSVVDRQADRYWLFIERVPGFELSQVGEFSIWQEVARWLARLHNHFASKQLESPELDHLSVVDRRSLKVWIGRACEYVRNRQPLPSSGELDRIDCLAANYNRVVDRLVQLPTSLIHGDFFASNVLIDSSSSSLRICPVDWEMSAIGPRWLDLAALVAGNWTDDQRHSLAMTYFAESAPENRSSDDEEAFWTGLQYCRLHLAVTMLGWSATWRAGPSHAYDWLKDAIHLSASLRID